MFAFSSVCDWECFDMHLMLSMHQSTLYGGEQNLLPTASAKVELLWEAPVSLQVLRGSCNE